MDDRNNNGIPDSRERKSRGSGSRRTRPNGGGSFGPGSVQKPSLSNSSDPLTGLHNWVYGKPGYSGQGEVYEPSQRYSGLFGNIANTANDITRNIGNWWGSEILGEKSPLGGGRGDATVGSNPRDRIGAPGRSGGLMSWAKSGGVQAKSGGVQGGMFDEPQLSLADYLSMASDIIGGGGGVNYDPQRDTARQNAAENDSRLEAMYRQLRGSIDADAPMLKKAYQEAIGSTSERSATAQSQAQAATDSANSRNSEVLANLGIQEAAGNIIQNGTDLNSQTARQITDMATRGQAAGDRLESNQASALQHNTNIGNAAGLEGNLQRAANQARLNALLAEIDMQEQQENASRADSRFSQQMSVAQQMLDFDRYNQERQDNLQMSAAELAAKGQNSMPDLGSFLKALGINPEDIAKDPAKYGSLLGSLKNYSVTP